MNLKWGEICLIYLNSRTATLSSCSCFLKSPISTFNLSFIAMSFWTCWAFSSSVFHCIWFPFPGFGGGSGRTRSGGLLGGNGGFLETILTSLSGFIVIISISRFVFVLFSQSVRRWTQLIFSVRIAPVSRATRALSHQPILRLKFYFVFSKLLKHEINEWEKE